MSARIIAIVIIALGFLAIAFNHPTYVVSFPEALDTPEHQPTFAEKVIAGAKAEVANETVYRETYQKLDYPGGDVPREIGVCTDLVVRAYRNAGIDLQKLLHEERVAHPEYYPTTLWDYKKADKNIDHRRCQNLVVYFKRHAQKIDASDESKWRAGDVIFFVKKGNKHPWHVGILAGGGELYHLYPPTANVGKVDDYGPIHSVYRWKE